MWNEILTALALVLVLEGILPFCNPTYLRKMFVLIAKMEDEKLRFIGLSSMLVGLLLLYLIH